MLTAFCFLFDRGNNPRAGLSPLAILYVKKVNISREQKLIKYFKQRNSDVLTHSSSPSLARSCPPSIVTSVPYFPVFFQF